MIEWVELHNEINEMFSNKSEKLGFNPKLELHPLEEFLQNIILSDFRNNGGLYYETI